MRPTDVLVLDPHVDLLEVGGQLVGVGADGLFVLDGVDPEGFRATLDLVDGRRTAAEIVAALSRTYDVADVSSLLEQLHGVVLQTRTEVAVSLDTLAAVRACVVGGGALATAIRGELARLGISDVEAVAGPSGDLSQQLTGRSLVICALEDVAGQAILDVNLAALQARLPALFVTMEGGRCVLGPLVLPGLSPCFVCSRLSTTFESHFEELGSAILPQRSHGSIDEGSRWLIERAAFDVGRDVQRLFARDRAPERLGDLLAISATGAAELMPFSAVTTCAACRGHHRRALHDATVATPAPRFSRSDLAICDQTGGARSVTPELAEQRARRALEALGIDMECVPLPEHAPETFHAFACPFYRAQPQSHFSPTGPIVFRYLSGNCFGKGTTEVQARCSAMFEWFERNLADWRGEQDLVRATYTQVRDRAVDVPFLASGRLPGLALPGRRPFDAEETVDWVWGHCLRRDRPLLLPAASVYLTTARFLGSAFELPRPGSSGLSAGCSLGDAVLQGLLEIVERDACHTALRTGVQRPVIALDSIEEPAARAILERMAAAGYVPLVRDITSDIGIPTFEVHVVRPGEYTNHYAAGWGAHLDPAIAIRRAVTEAAQALFFAVSTDSEDTVQSPSSFFTIYPHRRQALERTTAEPRRLEDTRRTVPAPRVWQQIDQVVAHVTAANPSADICFVDLSHPALEGIHVVRTLISGMFDEVSPVQVHVPLRCRLVPLEEMYLGALSM